MTRTAVAMVILLLASTIVLAMLPCSASTEEGVMVYGFVHDRSGLPVANVTMTLLLDNVPLHTGSNPAITDLHGYYEFIGIQRGTYCLQAEKYAFSSPSTVYVYTSDKQVDVILGGSTADLADIRPDATTPSPTAEPVNATVTPIVPETTPGASAAPGFEAVIALLCLLVPGLAKRFKE